MKVIHCADLHLDSQMRTHLDLTRARERRAELLRTFQRMVNFGASQGVEAILIAGDLFDTRHVSATARQVVMEAIEGHPEITFYYLKGNHDHVNFLEEELLPPNLFLFGDTWTSYELGMSGKVVLTGMELHSSNSNGAWHQLVLDAGRINLVTLHGQEAASEGSKKAEVINLRALRNKHIDYLALGHVHSYKEAQLDARGVYCYPGCLEGRGFDECGIHGFVLLDIDEERGTIERTFYNGGGRRIYEIDADVTGCQYTAQMIPVIRQSLVQAGCDVRSMVKIRLTGSVDVECEKDLTYMQTILADDYYLVKVVDETVLHVDPADYRMDRSLKGAFVRRVMEQTDLSEEEKARIIRYGLRAIAGEEINT